MWNHYPSQPNLTQQCKSTLWGSQSCPWWRRRRGSTWWMCRGRWRRQSRRRSRWSRKSVPDPAKLRLCRFVHKLVRHMACKSFTLKVFVHTYLEAGWLVSVWENCIFCLGFLRPSLTCRRVRRAWYPAKPHQWRTWTLSSEHPSSPEWGFLPEQD